MVLSTDLLPFNDTARLQVGNDPLHGPFGDAHPQRHLSENQRGIPRQQHQHMGMVGEEGPVVTWWNRLRVDTRINRVSRIWL